MNKKHMSKRIWTLLTVAVLVLGQAANAMPVAWLLPGASDMPNADVIADAGSYPDTAMASSPRNCHSHSQSQNTILQGATVQKNAVFNTQNATLNGTAAASLNLSMHDSAPMSMEGSCEENCFYCSGACVSGPAAISVFVLLLLPTAASLPGRPVSSPARRVTSLFRPPIAA